MIDLKNCSPMQLTPEALREDPCVQAAAFAMQQTGAWLLEQIDRTSVYASIDLLPENILEYGKVIRGVRHTYHRMAASIRR